MRYDNIQSLKYNPLDPDWKDIKLVCLGLLLETIRKTIYSNEPDDLYHMLLDEINH